MKNQQIKKKFNIDKINKTYSQENEFSSIKQNNDVDKKTICSPCCSESNDRILEKNNIPSENNNKEVYNKKNQNIEKDGIVDNKENKLNENSNNALTKIKTEKITYDDESIIVTDRKIKVFILKVLYI